MILAPESHFSVSVDRIDDSVGYTTANCRLIVACMNVGTNVKWTQVAFVNDHVHLALCPDDVA
jgi:hypothetical protein